MGKHFSGLNDEEKAAVAAFVRAEYDRLATLVPQTYIIRNAMAEPEGWQDRLRELIAMDPKRVQAVTEKFQFERSKTGKGFTLIELSIVLVIIGLLVGGVLAGQNLIHAAAVRAQISQIEKYNTAVNTFVGKYGELPGDLSAGAALTFGLAARAGTVGEGDGNGVIEGGVANGNQWAGEVVLFWADLSAASLIEGKYQGVDCPYGGSTCTSTTATLPIGAILPEAKIGGGNYITVFPDNGLNSYAIIGGGLTAIFNTGGAGGSGTFLSMTPMDSFSIDRKIDDGFPTTGNVISRAANWAATTTPGAGAAGTASAGNCGNTDTTPTSYNIGGSYANQAVCRISLHLQ